MKQNQTKQKLLLKKGDLVQVISGKDRGQKGKVLAVDRVKMRITVEGVNIATKHIKPNATNQEGRIEKFEAPIHYSNVLLFCESSGKGERLKIRANDDGTKTRVFAQSNISAD
ncbi:MAG: 50S ribosomal protein L24 [Candidatus Lambdaproteobacteria bacterium RIFOXYD2_FULL_50_16]|uniref:Large ribosomal subunit protein uL24 n=1 Tax=Candidatus Lambdaproteobacteria bacterium RIFOXYD2_FULL_50_16 TaxID=1817772 RepID=A0A1F6G6F0_9PROT|nr:MAG: 50S ribosomal protein L24 [Candidatus Lambdaproteobacteria bacterium RIFOXYD2_FULL_50_16]